MSCPDTGRRARRRGRRTKPQAAPVEAVAHPPSGRPRRGLVKRFRGAVARRQLVRVLNTPAAAPVVAVVVGVVLAAVVVGVVLGAALAAATREADR